MLKYFVRNRNFKSSSVSLSSEDAFEYEFPVNFRLEIYWIEKVRHRLQKALSTKPPSKRNKITSHATIQALESSGKENISSEYRDFSLRLQNKNQNYIQEI